MKVVHLTHLLSHRGGGIPPVVVGLARAQREAGMSAEVWGIRDPRGGSISPDAIEMGARGPVALGWAPGMLPRLLEVRPHILHLHGLFTWPSQVARNWGRRTGRPVVIAPQGMLESWALANSAWKKRIFRWLIEDGNLASAACLHAVTAAEAADFRRLGLGNPVAVLPNALELRKLPAPMPRAALDRMVEPARGRPILLFLARIHPKKGLPLLLDAWAALFREGALSRHGWLLLIAGPDQLGHAAEMREKARALGLERWVHFAGPLYGDAKWAALSAADGFVLPSLSEGLPVAVLEAMAFKVPVLVTRQCNLDVEELRAGIAAEHDAGSLAAGLRRLLALGAEERRAMGEAGRRAVEGRYSWARIAAETDALYRWLVGEGAKPPCVEVSR